MDRALKPMPNSADQSEKEKKIFCSFRAKVDTKIFENLVIKVAVETFLLPFLSEF